MASPAAGVCSEAQYRNDEVSVLAFAARHCTPYRPFDHMRRKIEIPTWRMSGLGGLSDTDNQLEDAAGA